MIRLIVILLFALCGCQNSSSQPAEQKPSVLVSVAPYAYFIEKIGAPFLDVHILIPPTANPHVYEPSPKQVDKILHTSLWFRLGEQTEDKVLHLLKEKNPSYVDIDLSSALPASETITLSSCCHTHAPSQDKHFWLSPRVAQVQVKAILEALEKLYPVWKDHFHKNGEALLKELSLLDEELKITLRPFAGQTLLVSHPAFGYFCKAYHLEQLSIETEGKDPLPQDIAHTLHKAEHSSIRAVFIQAQYQNKAASLIAEKLHLPLYEVDPYDQDYPKSMRNLATLITRKDV